MVVSFCFCCPLQRQLSLPSPSRLCPSVFTTVLARPPALPATLLRPTVPTSRRCGVCVCVCVCAISCVCAFSCIWRFVCFCAFVRLRVSTPLLPLFSLFSFSLVYPPLPQIGCHLPCHRSHRCPEAQAPGLYIVLSLSLSLFPTLSSLAPHLVL